MDNRATVKSFIDSNTWWTYVQVIFNGQSFQNQSRRVQPPGKTQKLKQGKRTFWVSKTYEKPGTDCVYQIPPITKIPNLIYKCNFNNTICFLTDGGMLFYRSRIYLFSNKLFPVWRYGFLLELSHMEVLLNILQKNHVL